MFVNNSQNIAVFHAAIVTYLTYLTRKLHVTSLTFPSNHCVTCQSMSVLSAHQQP